MKIQIRGKYKRVQIRGFDTIKTNKSNLHLNTLESMNYENNEAIIPSF